MSMVPTPTSTVIEGNVVYIGTGYTLGNGQVLGTPFTSSRTNIPVDPTPIKFAALHDSGTLVQAIYQSVSDPSVTWDTQGVGKYLVEWRPSKPGVWSVSLFGEGEGQAAAVGVVTIEPNPLLF